MPTLRKRVSLDPDVVALLEQQMREQSISFNEALNQAVRMGTAITRFRTPTFQLGVKPGVNLTKALQLAGDLEDEEIIRKMQRGK